MGDLNNEISKVHINSEGDIVDVEKIKELLLKYWQLNEAEKRSFDRMSSDPLKKEKYRTLWEI